MDSQVYICHCINDKEIVSVLKACLEAEGIGVYCDDRVIRGGDPLQPESRQIIEQAKAFILVISPQAQDSKWVREETHYALQVAGDSETPLRIMPILINGAELGALKWLFPSETQPLEITDSPGSVAAVLPIILKGIGMG